MTDARVFNIISELQSGTREVVDAELARSFERLLAKMEVLVQEALSLRALATRYERGDARAQWSEVRFQLNMLCVAIEDALPEVLPKPTEENEMANQKKSKKQIVAKELKAKRIVIEYFHHQAGFERLGTSWGVRIVGGNGEIMLTSEAYDGDNAKANAKRAAMGLAGLMDKTLQVSVVEKEAAHG